MNPKVVAVVLVVLVVAGGLALFYGAVRPEGRTGDPGASVEDSLGWLRSTRAVTFDDLAGAPCADVGERELVVSAGQVCRSALPESAELGLCTVEGAGAAVVSGRSFPDQRFDDGDLACGRPARISTYDEDPVLHLACVVGTCRFAVVDP